MIQLENIAPRQEKYLKFQRVEKPDSMTHK